MYFYFDFHCRNQRPAKEGLLVFIFNGFFLFSVFFWSYPILSVFSLNFLSRTAQIASFFRRFVEIFQDDRPPLPQKGDPAFISRSQIGLFGRSKAIRCSSLYLRLASLAAAPHCLAVSRIRGRRKRILPENSHVPPDYRNFYP